MNLKEELGKIIEGDVSDDEVVLAVASHDYSIFNVRPKIVVYPHDVEDIKRLVRFVAEHKKEHPELSLTMRAAGTDMTGGPLNTSIVVDVTRYFSGIVSLDPEKKIVSVLPGTYYRDFEKALVPHGLVMPCFPASKDLCAVGGMVANNGAGEKSLKYGQNKNYVVALKVILSDGEEYDVKPLSRAELDAVIARGGTLGNLYRDILQMVTKNTVLLQKEKPVTSKNSAGYLMWDIWDPATGIFDPTKFFVGAQGTTGIITEITYRLVPIEKYSKLLVVFVRRLDEIPALVTDLAKSDLDTLEVYDDNTFRLAVRFMRDFIRNKGIIGTLRFAFSFLPELWMGIRGGTPKMIVLAEFVGNDERGLIREAKIAQKNIAHLALKSRIIASASEREKYWSIRRDSFKLLSDHTKRLRTAPFIDDIVVNPEHLPEYLPRLTKLLDEYKILYTIAGHLGNGNLHVIPLMDFHDPATRTTILELAPKVYALAREYHGSITAEHNDGIIRTPYLSFMFSSGMLELFKTFKNLLDPLGIFNPSKKVGGTKEDIEKYLVAEK